MKYLLYGIIRHTGFPLIRDGRGGLEDALRIVPVHDLAAVVSEIDSTRCTRPDLATLIAFEKAVSAIHRGQTVVPIRYGCLMESVSEIVHLLEGHRQQYDALLTRLQGTTEIGIRLKLPPRPAPIVAPATTPGAAYLATIRSRCDIGSSLAPEEVGLVEEIAKALARYCAEQRWEIVASAQGRLLSMYFLVSRREVDGFRASAREIGSSKGIQFLLSGPWPPYNFAADSQKYYGSRTMAHST